MEDYTLRRRDRRLDYQELCKENWSVLSYESTLLLDYPGLHEIRPQVPAHLQSTIIYCIRQEDLGCHHS